LHLVDAATAAEGRHYIHGAGWDTIGATNFPVVHSALTVAFLLRIPWNDANASHRVELDVLYADGASILPNPPGPMGRPITVGRPANVVPGNDLLVPLVFNLAGITIPQPGDYVVVMRVEGEEVKRFPLHLVSLVPQMPFPAASPQ
jgi:hypothetical protein